MCEAFVCLGKLDGHVPLDECFDASPGMSTKVRGTTSEAETERLRILMRKVFEAGALPPL